VVRHADGSVTFTPAANFSGTAGFDYTVSDGVGSDSGHVTVTVAAVNDAPVAQAQTVSTPENTARPITLTGSDIDGPQALSFAVLAGPANGTLSGAPPTVTYTPAAGYTGGDSFTFEVHDGVTASLPATVTITVTSNAASIAPTITAHPADVTVTAPTVAIFTVAATGTAPLVYQWRKDGAAIDGATGASFTLDPTAVSDSGPYDVVVSNGAGSVTSATATLTVNAPAPGGVLGVLIEAHFDAGADAFEYADDVFRDTNQPSYANGSHIATGGFSGGGLQVHVGLASGSSTILDMSGGWQRTFTLASSAQLTLSFRFRLAPNGLDAGEIAQMLVSLDGVLHGVAPADYIAVVGDGSSTAIGWQQVQIDLGTVPAGTHTLALGGFLTQRSRYSEWGEVTIDDVLLTD
jgi:hypothetical protein